MWLTWSESDMSIVVACVPWLRWSVCTIHRWGLFLLIIELPTSKLIIYVGRMGWSKSLCRTEAFIPARLEISSLLISCRCVTTHLCLSRGVVGCGCCFGNHLRQKAASGKGRSEGEADVFAAGTADLQHLVCNLCCGGKASRRI